MRPTAVAAIACLISTSGACALIIRDPFAGSQTRVSAEVKLSRAQAVADLEDMFRKVERIHPAPYRFQSREVVVAERQRLIDTMPEQLTTMTLCLRLSRLLATLNEGHTSTSCNRLVSDEWRRAAMASPPEAQKVRVFPPYMLLDDQQRLVVEWPMFVPGLESGDRLLRLNGQDADALLAAWAREESHDTEFGSRTAVARTFRVQLALRGIEAPYRVDVAGPGGAPRAVVIQGEPVNYQFNEWPRPSPAVVAPPAPPAPAAGAKEATAVTPQPATELRTPFFNYQVIPTGIGYMDFFSLFDGLSTEDHFKGAVKALFARIAADQPRVLIIDVRRNGGGDDTIGAELLRHITEKPFRLIASSQVKRSSEARDRVRSLLRIPFRWMGLEYLSSDTRQYFTGTAGSLAPPDDRPLRSWTRGEPFFGGPVCVLTGPRSFSAAAEFADAVKTYQLATIVGEETGGRPNDFGNNLPFLLPNSKLTVNIATVSAVRANGNAADPNAVIPDILVRRTAADIKIGNDPVLERAKSCPARSIR